MANLTYSERIVTRWFIFQISNNASLANGIVLIVRASVVTVRIDTFATNQTSGSTIGFVDDSKSGKCFVKYRRHTVEFAVFCEFCQGAVWIWYTSVQPC